LVLGLRLEIENHGTRELNLRPVAIGDDYRTEDPDYLGLLMKE
jgi:hypothetical protein